LRNSAASAILTSSAIVVLLSVEVRQHSNENHAMAVSVNNLGSNYTLLGTLPPRPRVYGLNGLTPEI